MFYNTDEKAKIVALVSKSSKPVKEVCKEYGISDASYYNWHKQLPGGDSKQPALIKEQNSEDAEAAKLLALKNEHPYYGAVKLSKQLLRTYGVNLHPGKVKRILDEHGFKQEQIPKAPPKGTRRFLISALTQMSYG